MSVDFVPTWIQENFEKLERSLNGEVSKRPHQLRRLALAELTNRGLPTPRTESWKYTDLQRTIRQRFSLPDGSAARSKSGQHEIQDLSSYRVELFNGKLASTDLPRPAGLSIISIRDALNSDGVGLSPESQITCSNFGKIAAGIAEHGFEDLNTTFFQDGVAIIVAPGVVIDKPVELVITSSGSKLLLTPRVLIVAGKNSQLSVLERYQGTGDYLTSALTEVHVEEGAKLSHIKVQCESEDSTHIGQLFAKVRDSASLTTTVCSFGGGQVRNEVHPTLDGTNIDCHLYGLSVLNGTQHVDNQTVLDHAKPHSQSNELYKGIYSDSSRGVFSGTIIVRQDAQKTNAIQSNQALLLSDRARIDSRPQLKIWADDVKCTHGATVGQLDEDALFYIRSRGVPKEAARNMLIHAFASDLFRQIADPAIKAHLEKLLTEKLEGADVAEE